MIIEIQANRLWAKLSIAVATLFLCAVLAVAMLTQVITGILTDERVTVSRELLASGVRYVPNSAPLQARLAEAEMAEAERDLPNIEARAIRAINLSPWDYNYQLLLASIKETRGDRAEAEKALRTALSLAPNNTDVHWRLANLLLRQGKMAGSLEEFRKAISTDAAYLPSTLELIWRVSGGRLDAVNALAGDRPESKLLLARFLLNQSRVAEAGSVFNSIDVKARLAIPESSAFIDSLIVKGDITLARYLWASTLSANDTTQSIWNGGFESDVVKGFAQFDWTISRNDYVRPAIDSGTFHNGLRSLRLDFAGRDTTRLDGEIKQLAVVRPGARYRLECYAKTDAFQTPEGPRVVVANITLQSEIAASDAIAAGTNDWRRISIEFVAPQSAQSILIRIKRVPRFSYDEPTKGTVWFDDFTLTEQDTGK
ncbi:MAG: tetratricopeptide repeat protein [Blastocatellia bacterium]